uniref:C-myc promoter-binding protein-like isoform X2 n=1 Tax=Crassostrea virginica TaxID=6565 RepID=A0A8B8DU02_CRAVI|nr:C-myc promoter-binding protein-like isoform X2 [Crassostrea virginica]
MDDRRVADYFVVAGLPENPLPLEEFSNEAAIKPTYKQDPITDIAVIDKTLGEKVPKGYTCIERTQSNYLADLNHGSIRCHEMFLCYRRGRDKPPLTDVGVLYEGKERLMSECEIVHTTPWGSPANVNNGSNGRIYITYRRARETAASDTLAVVDVVIILQNKNEIAPHAYHKIEKNLNRGMVGSDVFVCYKKAMVKADILAYKPGLIQRYPEEDYENFPLPPEVPQFCLPMGASIECWSAKAQHPLPVFSTFVLTLANNEKVYGAAVTFYEEFEEEKLSDLQMRHLGLKNKHIREQYRILKTVHSNKSICLLSHWPFFDAFRKFLTYLYRISITGPHPVPIERHISHFMFDVPYPSPQRPRILVQLNHDALSLSMPEDSPLPQSGASYVTMLKNMGPENCMSLLLYSLLEYKILVHSLRPAVLTGVVEAIAGMIFPLHWQCAYIPLCPLGLSDMLSAPVPYIVGIDSRYFDLYDPPPDVVCVDLDTVTISLPDDKKGVNYRSLPKKPARVLQDTLHKLFDELSTRQGLGHTIDEVNLEMGSFDTDFKRKRTETLLELSIQEALLRFMACLLKGYKNFLKPITKAPTESTTDPASLFDLQGFLRSRDKANLKFFQQMIKTQTFISFISERSFVSDKDASIAFFDECMEKVDENKDEPKLIDIDESQNSERTVFIMPPDPVGLPEGKTYSYNGFPELRSELFLKKQISNASLNEKPAKSIHEPLSRRTKQEIRSAQKMAHQYANDPQLWAKCLLSHCYSLWFIHLPAYIDHSKSLNKCMKEAYDVLQKMQLAKLQPPDEMCYRVMLQLCCLYNQPVMAVKVLYQMKRANVQPNAITYGYYNKAVFEGTWPSTRSNASILWRKLRNVIIGAAQFRRRLRRRSMSINSNSGSDYDRISRTSIDSFLEDHGEQRNAAIMIKSDIFSDSSQISTASKGTMSSSTTAKDENSSTGGVSDKGYNSMSREELKSLSHPVSNGETAETEQDKARKDKTSLRFTLPTPHKVKDKKETNGGNPDITFTEVEPNFRNRVGSIVRKSLGSVSSSGSHETLKGSMMTSSQAGLLMLSQHSLDASSFPQDANLQSSLNAGDNKRKRHRSAGDYHTKTTRSNSVFNNWRPRHISGDTSCIARTQKEIAFEDDDIFVEENVISRGNLEGINETTDSGVIVEDSQGAGNLCERPQELDLNDDPSQSSSSPFDIPQRKSLLSESSSFVHSVGTPVTENDPLGLFREEDAPGAPEDEKVVMRRRNIQTQPFHSERLSYVRHSANFDEEIHPQATLITDPDDPNVVYSVREIDPSEAGIKCNIPDDQKASFRLGSGLSLDETMSNEFLGGPRPLSQMEKIGKRLKEMGRTQSTPDNLDEQDRTSKSGFSAVTSYLKSFQSPTKKSQDSLDDVDVQPSESRFARLGSFRKGERLSGAFKSAAGALMNKVHEIKQTISTTPVKYGSTQSLGRSSDNLDKEDRRGRDMPGRSLDHHRKPRNPLEEFDNLHAFPNSSLPSSSFMEQYVPLKEFGENKSVTFASLENTLQNIAMEIEISSCFRCNRCRALLYDEEIMAGWSADDSNLNTTCIFCQNKLVPKLQIYVKDWRGTNASSLGGSKDDDTDKHSNTTDPEVHSSHSNHDPWILQEKINSNSSLENSNVDFFFGEEHLEGEGPLNVLESPERAKRDSHLAKAALSNTTSPRSSSSMDLEGIALNSRRRCASECFTTSTDNMMYGSSFDSTEEYGSYLSSPIRISIGEDVELPTGPDPTPEMKKDFMERCTTSVDPITVPYLSPLVLRKELDNILANEGDMALGSDEFLDQHPIIFWNLVWYFKRLEVPSHVPGFLLTAKSINGEEGNVGLYSSKHVLIRPLWDNVRIHEEVGLPMYRSWNEGRSSHTVDALITEAQPFNRAILHQIIESIMCNDLLTPIKLVMNCRRRLRLRKSRHRSMYRDIVFLAFLACGKENIDHDAFDREYRQAFNKLSHMEIKRTQRDDRPRKTRIIWCRKVFGDLEV